MSSTQRIEGINVTHLTLHSDDDPMVGTYSLPRKEIEQGSHVVITSRVDMWHD